MYPRRVAALDTGVRREPTQRCWFVWRVPPRCTGSLVVVPEAQITGPLAAHHSPEAG
jgi:hypothetical protein